MSQERTLSVHQGHEVLLAFERAGLDRDLAQRVIQSKGNELARQAVQFIKCGRKLDWREAKEIVGTNLCFGPDERFEKFRRRLEMLGIPSFPWGEREVQEMADVGHFFFLAPRGPRREQLDLRDWHSNFSGEHPKFKESLSWWNYSFAFETCRYEWYAMPLLLTGVAVNLSRSEAFALVPSDYQISLCVERAAANFLFYLKNGAYLDKNGLVFTASQPRGDYEGSVFLTAITEYGLHVQTQMGGQLFGKEKNFYIALMRKQPAVESVQL